MIDFFSNDKRPDIIQCNAYIAQLYSGIDPNDAKDPLSFLMHMRRINLEYPNLGKAQPQPEGVQFFTEDADGVPVLWAVAEGSSTRHRIVYIHGGGWITGSPEIYRCIAGTLSTMSRSSVALVNYRLAPEHRFPAGLVDCFTVFQWAANHGPDGEVCHALSISLVGDSAGGNLAVASGLQAVLAGRRLPDCIVSIGGVFDLRSQFPEHTNTSSDWSRSLAFITTLYLSPSDNAQNPLISPQAGPAELLRNLPAILLQFSNSEMTADTNRSFAAKLDKAGVRNVISVWPDLPHVWHLFPSVLPEATAAIMEVSQFIIANQTKASIW